MSYGLTDFGSGQTVNTHQRGLSESTLSKQINVITLKLRKKCQDKISCQGKEKVKSEERRERERKYPSLGIPLWLSSLIPLSQLAGTGHATVRTVLISGQASEAASYL